MKKPIILLLFIPVFFWGCPEIEQVSPVPEIHFVSQNIVDGVDSLDNKIKIVKVEFSFIDGDADLGVYNYVNSDTSQPDSVKFGIYINIFEKKDGEYTIKYPPEVIHETITTTHCDTLNNDTIPTCVTITRDTSYIDTIVFDKYLPYDEKLNRTGQNKTVKGIIRVEIPFQKQEIPEYDSMRFEFFIRDRALHKSNVEIAPDFSRYDLVSTQ
jgi:hypothetical protein